MTVAVMDGSDEGGAAPTQLRFGYERVGGLVQVRLSRRGRAVAVQVAGGSDHAAARHFAAAGIRPGGGTPTRSADDWARGVVLPAAVLPRLAALSAEVTVTACRDLAPLVRLVGHPPDAQAPAVLQVAGDGLQLSWFDGAAEHRLRLSDAGASILLEADLPFVADRAAWERVGVRRLPLLTGQARMRSEGFVEISTTRPQMLEAAPLPGLFRIDGTRFGLAAQYADTVDTVGAITWVGTRPTPPPDIDHGPQSLHGPGGSGGLQGFTAALERYGGQMLVWPSGQDGRRFTLDAVAALDGWPAVVAAPSWSLPLWVGLGGQRGRCVSVDAAAPGCALTVLAYRWLPDTAALPDGQSVVFDEPACGQAQTVPVRAALRRFGALAGSYRVALAAAWPERDDEAVAVMSLVRPGEFRPDRPTGLRYPPDARRRLAEHLSAYRYDGAAPEGGDVPDEGMAAQPRRVVQTVDTDDLFARELVGLHPDDPDAPESQAALVSGGSDRLPSPKLAAAARLVAAETAAGRRVAVVSRWARTRQRLTAVLPAGPLVTVDRPSRMSGLTADVLVCVDPGLDTSVPDGLPRPALRVDLHMPGTVDDDLAEYAAREALLTAAGCHNTCPYRPACPERHC